MAIGLPVFLIGGALAGLTVAAGAAAAPEAVAGFLESL